jgi:TonB family protein
MKTIKNLWIKLAEALSLKLRKLVSIFQRNNTSSVNAAYGSAELKRSYQKYFARGFEIAVILHVIVVSAYLIFVFVMNKNSNSLSENHNQRIINVSLTDLAPPPPITEETPPPKEIEKIITPKKDLQSLEPEPVRREKAEEQTIKTQKELEEIKTPVSNVGDTVSFNYTGPVKVEEKKVEEKIQEEKPEKKERTVYQSFEVEKPPEAVNLRQVQSSMTYPEIARQADIEGRVVVKVLVGRDGNVIRVGSITGPDVFHEEVMSKVRELEFTPGLQNGRAVEVWVSVPFNFSLK